jgi:hypothetical protein
MYLDGRWLRTGSSVEGGQGVDVVWCCVVWCGVVLYSIEVSRELIDWTLLLRSHRSFCVWLEAWACGFVDPIDRSLVWKILSRRAKKIVRSVRDPFVPPSLSLSLTLSDQSHDPT